MRLGRIAGAAAAAAVGALMYLAILHLTGNFHTVIAGEFYRSAQMQGDDLARWTDRHGIRSVVNLRGAHLGTDWYDAEIASARELGLAHFDVQMSAADHIDAATAETLLAVLKQAPKPVLVHCQGGADRTGLATSLYVSAVAGWGEEAAEWQLSFLYGHIGVPKLSYAWPMNQSWEALEPWLGWGNS